RHTRSDRDWSSDVCSSDLIDAMVQADTAGGMRPHIAWSGLGFRVLVREEDVAEARGVLEPPEGVSAAKLVAVQSFGTLDQAETRSEERRVGKEAGWGGSAE